VKAPRSILRDPPRRRLALRFSPTAWAKLLFFRDRGETEIGGFGITSANDLLRIEEFQTVKQGVTMASVAFEDEAVADLFDQQVNLGRRPEQFARLWVHSHPGDSPEPSGTDEETFERVFGRCQWAVMFIIGRTGKTYACLRFNVGPGGRVLIPVEVDYSGSFGGSDRATWEAEYKENIQVASWTRGLGGLTDGNEFLDGDLMDGRDWLERFEQLDHEERVAVIDELAGRPELWSGETEEDPR
jgi:proteasome lid subunit RPN8/RPN11